MDGLNEKDDQKLGKCCWKGLEAVAKDVPFAFDSTPLSGTVHIELRLYSPCIFGSRLIFSIVLDLPPLNIQSFRNRL